MREGRMIRPKLPFPLVVTLLVAFAVPALIEQARDVDVLLYMAAAARANDAGTLPYVAAWIEKGPLAMGSSRCPAPCSAGTAFSGSPSCGWPSGSREPGWPRSLAREAGAGWSEGWAALLFAVSIGAVGGTLNTEVPAMVAAAGACLALLRGRSSLAGILVGVAFLCRQNTGILWPVFVLVEAAPAWSGRRSWTEASGKAARISLGFLRAVRGGDGGLRAGRCVAGICFFASGRTTRRSTSLPRTSRPAGSFDSRGMPR
jgi:hypothetical protein